MVLIQQKIVHLWRLWWLSLLAAGLLLTSATRLGAQAGEGVDKTAVFPPRPNHPYTSLTTAEKAEQQRLLSSGSGSSG